MRHPVLRCAVSILTLAFATALEAQTHTTGDFHGCAPNGDATATSPADPDLNALKNRDVAPASFTNKSVASLTSDVPAASTARKKRRDKWTQAQRTSVAAKEITGITVTGYLAGVKKEGVESCNCHDASRVDYHMWLVQNPEDKKSKSMVVELSPRLLDAHPKWPALAKTAWHSGDHVRISGWRTWDQEHPDQQGKTRATLWEIHPIHRIEVEAEDGSWVDIEHVEP